MKKLLLGVFAIILCVTISGCGNTISKNPPTVEQGTNVDKQKINVGDTIVTENMEVVINSVVLTYDVLPDDTSGFYTHYAAATGKVYICVDADVTNKAKQNLDCDKIGKVIADYNNGYTYNGFTIVDDPSTGFTYANITSVDPLETKGIKWLIECPQEVEESDKSLFLELTVEDKKFVYTIR